MGIADRYADGEWNFYCDLCGRKAKSSTAMKTWDNHYVCRHHKEVRNPQDFLRGVKEHQSVPWTRPESLSASAQGTGILDTSGGLILDTSGSYLISIGS